MDPMGHIAADTPAPAVPAPADAMAVQAEDVAAFLRALANPARLRVLCALAEGEHTVLDLARRVGLSQPNLSQHLARLRADGVVATRRTGTSIRYRIACPRTLAVMATLHALFCAPSGAAASPGAS